MMNTRKCLITIIKYLLFFHIGGCLYYYIEILYRGWSHWSMYVLGGICFLFITLQRKHPFLSQSIVRQVLRCDFFVICGEFITGCMVNLWQGWAVWDYIERPMNLMGQICLPLAFVFAGLCLTGIVLSELLEWLVFEEKKPFFIDALKRLARISNSENHIENSRKE